MLFIVIAFVLYWLAYKFYATYISEKIWNLDPNRQTPAVKYDDGFEFVPTRKDVVFGHHFVSVTGAAPIIGPVTAAIWGWLPAVVWIILGTIFIGAVHDIGALVTSLRHDGRGLADFLKDLLGPTATKLMYVVAFFLLVLVIAVFNHVIATLLVAFPQGVYSIWVEIPLAIIIGLMLRYKYKINLYVATIISVAIMYGLIWVGTIYPVELDYWTWVVILLVYMFIAARLPVWMLVQPRDFINGTQLVIALVLSSLGVIALSFMGDATVAAPAIRIAPEGAPPIWPFVMITIACGAISGFHSLVASGTTPKQLKNEKDAKLVGYGSMLTEGYLAVIALLTAVVGLGVAGYQEWYPAWGVAEWPAVFPQGGAAFLSAIGIPVIIGATFFSVVLKSFAMTTLDSCMRLARICVVEATDTFNAPAIFKDKTVSMLPGFIVAAFLCFTEYQMELWPIFGASNQILAGLALIAAAVFLKTLKKPTTSYIIPFIIMIITSMVAMGYNIIMAYIPNEQWTLVIIGAIIFFAALGIVLTSYSAWTKKQE